MSSNSFSRRTILKATAAVGASVFAAPLRAAAPEASPITPALIEAAKKEGKLVFYTAMDLQLAEHFGKTFEAKYPGIAVRVERSGAERVFQRIGQEYGEQHPRRRRGQHRRPGALHRLEAERLACALSAGGGRQVFTTRPITIPTRCI